MKYFPLAVVLLGLSSCTEEQDVSPDLGYDFYPLQVGKYWEYQVDSVVYDDDGARVDTAQLFFREEIVEQRLDEAGDTVYVAERSERYYADAPWLIREVFSLRRTRTQAIRTENNLSFIKLIFPIRRNKRWDGNLFFNSSLNIPVAGENVQPFLYWEYRYSDVKNDTVIVQLADYEISNKDIRHAQEKYTKGVGLTERTWTILSTQCGGQGTLDCGNLPWSEKAERGFIISQKLIRHN